MENTGFNIKGIFVQDFSVQLCKKFINEDQKTPGGFRNYTFEISCFNSAILEQNLINMIVNIKVFLDQEKKTELGKLSLGNLYEFQNLKSFYKEDTNELTLPEQIEAMLIGISLSHSRAILLAKCAGTFLQNAVIPILNPMEFIAKAKKDKDLA